ncbi:MAG: hypothetical protein KAZ85_00090 [Gammaproteobacteria bacterium]|nr:hypothetical protein [Gammaproteobacteria bacterium]
MLVFGIFIVMLLTIALGIWLSTSVLANLVALAGITGLLIVFFHNADQREGKISQWLMGLNAQQKKQWYGLFTVSLFFGLMFGNFWNASMGGL